MSSVLRHGGQQVTIITEDLSDYEWLWCLEVDLECVQDAQNQSVKRTSDQHQLVCVFVCCLHCNKFGMH